MVLEEKLFDFQKEMKISRFYPYEAIQMNIKVTVNVSVKTFLEALSAVSASKSNFTSFYRLFEHDYVDLIINNLYYIFSKSPGLFVNHQSLCVKM